MSLKNDKILEIQCNLMDVENQARDQQIMQSNALQAMEMNLAHQSTISQSLTFEVNDWKTKMESIQNNLCEQQELIAKLKLDKDELNVELRVAKTKLEEYVIELQSIKERHHADVENLLQHENEKYVHLQLDMNMQKIELDVQLKKLRDECEQLGNQKVSIYKSIYNCQIYLKIKIFPF